MNNKVGNDRELMEKGIAATRPLAATSTPEERLATARTLVFRVAQAYWEAEPGQRAQLPLRQLPADIELVQLHEDTAGLVAGIGEAATTLDPIDAGHVMGGVYTVTMPDRLRARLGAYYTPPALCERLLDMTSDAGVDWATARVLDPACGGGAFLAPVARRIANALLDQPASSALKAIEARLQGFEIDPFAAWLSHVILDATLADLCREAGVRLRSVVRVCDSLQQMPDAAGFDLVVGNPREPQPSGGTG